MDVCSGVILAYYIPDHHHGYANQENESQIKKAFKVVVKA
jgi:hypothetical protein